MSIPATPPGAPSQGAAPLTPGTMLFEYRIRRVLGTGGFGITYEAQDPLLDKIVAIKEYLPSELAVRTGNSVSVRSDETREGFNWGRDEFIKEARVLARFNHPSLIHVYRFFEANNTAYFVMEYAEGQTLDAILMKDGLMPEARIKQILLPILDGLKEVHRARVLHRDIKPSNMIARKDGSAVLIDFGSARQDVSSMTQSMMSVVTPGYAPVEQYAVDGHQGPWTDIYALGAVAYRAIAGKRPIESVSRLNTDTLVPATKIGAGKYSLNFLRAIDWALAVHPEDRPVGIADWRMAIEGTLQVPVRDVRSGPRADLKVADPVETGGADSTQSLKVGTESAPPRQPVVAPAEWALMEDKPTVADEAATAAAAAKAAQKLVRTHADPAGVWHRPLPPRVTLTQPAASPAPPAPPDLAPAPAPAPAIATSGGASAAPAPAAASPVPVRPAGVAAPVAATADLPVGSTSPSSPDHASPPASAGGSRKLLIGAAALAGIVAVGAILATMSGGDDDTEKATAAGAAPRKPVKRVEEAKKAGAVVLTNKAAIPVASMSALSSFSDCDVCPVMVALPPGGFLMGSPADAITSEANEQPEHRVTFDTPFAAGAHEVRNREWQACVDAGACPAAGSAEERGPDELPVVNVTRHDAEKYTQWLSQVTQRKYRLPTEAQWEYAARADSTNPWFWGQSGPQCNFANGADLASRELLGKEAPKTDCRDGHAARAPAGSFQPNDFGLYDTAGNVAEWQLDCWRENYEAAAADPAAPCGSYAVRGGSFRMPPPALRSAARQARAAEERADDLGFRVVAE